MSSKKYQFAAQLLTKHSSSKVISSNNFRILAFTSSYEASISFLRSTMLDLSVLYYLNHSIKNFNYIASSMVKSSTERIHKTPTIIIVNHSIIFTPISWMTPQRLYHIHLHTPTCKTFLNRRNRHRHWIQKVKQMTGNYTQHMYK